MAINRQPTASVVNGAYLQVRDPNAESGALFATYQTMPGLTSFTLPAETGAVSETPLMDGVVSAAQFKGVGTITAAVGALGAHPVHLFMEKASLEGNSVQLNIVRPATHVGNLALSPNTYVTQSTNSRRINIMGDAARLWVRNNVLWGHMVTIRTTATMSTALNDDARNALGVATFDKATPVAADNTLWQLVLAVHEDGDYIDVAPGFEADVTVAASMTGTLFVRNPGRTYANILGTVNQWDAGDFQGGAVVTGNMSFTPTVAMPLVTVEQRTTLD